MSWQAPLTDKPDVPAKIDDYLKQNDLKKMDFQYFTRHGQKVSNHLLNFYIKL